MRGVSGAMATILERHGSAPSTPGQKLWVGEDGSCVGSVGGGVWKTTGAGTTWVPVFDSIKEASCVGAVEVAPSDPNVIYVGMGDLITGGGINESFTVRKISYGEGVERVFPVYSPNIDSIKVVRRGKVRRAKLYYLRDRRGKSARITEKLETPAQKAAREAANAQAPTVKKAAPVKKAAGAIRAPKKGGKG